MEYRTTAEKGLNRPDRDSDPFAQHEEHPTVGRSSDTGTGKPDGEGLFVFEPSKDVDVDIFESMYANIMTAMLKLHFGPFDYVRISENEWLVERAGAIFGKVTKYWKSRRD